jgi:hypothetical protein
MKKKKRGKYKYKRTIKLEEKEAAKLMWEVLVKEVKKHIGIGYEK